MHNLHNDGPGPSSILILSEASLPPCLVSDLSEYPEWSEAPPSPSVDGNSDILEKPNTAIESALEGAEKDIADTNASLEAANYFHVVFAHNLEQVETVSNEFPTDALTSLSRLDLNRSCCTSDIPAIEASASQPKDKTAELEQPKSTPAEADQKLYKALKDLEASNTALKAAYDRNAGLVYELKEVEEAHAQLLGQRLNLRRENEQLTEDLAAANATIAVQNASLAATEPSVDEGLSTQQIAHHLSQFKHLDATLGDALLGRILRLNDNLETELLAARQLASNHSEDNRRLGFQLDELRAIADGTALDKAKIQLASANDTIQMLSQDLNTVKTSLTESRQLHNLANSENLQFRDDLRAKEDQQLANLKEREVELFKSNEEIRQLRAKLVIAMACNEINPMWREAMKTAAEANASNYNNLWAHYQNAVRRAVGAEGDAAALREELVGLMEEMEGMKEKMVEMKHDLEVAQRDYDEAEQAESVQHKMNEAMKDVMREMQAELDKKHRVDQRDGEDDDEDGDEDYEEDDEEDDEDNDEENDEADE